MAAQQYSVVSQKLYLARALLTQLEHIEGGTAPGQAPAAVQKQALGQASAEMLLRARQILLVMVARYHQHKQACPRTLEELEALFSYSVPDLEALQQLATTPDSWWNHLARLEKALNEPVAPNKPATTENVIAVSSEPEADFSPAALEKTRSAVAAFARTLSEQHNEW